MSTSISNIPRADLIASVNGNLRTACALEAVIAQTSASVVYSEEDATKLAGIEDGAQVNVDPGLDSINETLTSLENSLGELELQQFLSAGNYRILNTDGSITTTQGMFKESEKVENTISAIWQEMAINTTGYQTCIITRSSGDVGTLLIEGWTGQGSWVKLTGTTSDGLSTSMITGKNSTVRVSCVGFIMIRVRCSIWVENMIVSLKCSTASFVPFESSESTIGEIVIGSQNAPLVQEQVTNRLLTESPRLESLLEDILMELISLNENLNNN